MFSRQILAVLPLLICTALAVVDLRVAGRVATAEPQWVSDSQSSASLVISALLASLNSDAASHTSFTAAASSVSSTPTQLSSTTTTATASSSQVTPASTSQVTPASTTQVTSTSPSATPPTSSSSLSSTTAIPASTSSSSTIDNRTQTIILAVCFALLGLILLTIAVILLHRYRRRQSPFSPFSRRGASPIDDDEIATWRGNTQPMAKTPSQHVRKASSIVFQPYPGWTWNVSSSPDSPATPPPGSGEALPYPPPPPVAHAPNARSGLTDGVVPGAAPFVAPARRQSRRLSKSASAGQMRSKSRRNSASVSSFREPRTSTSNRQWTEPEEWAVQRKRSNSGPRAAKTAVGRTSMGDDVRPGGLSPRPVTAPNVPALGIPGSAH